MKKIRNTYITKWLILQLLLAMVVVTMIPGCDKNDSDGGTPVIYYVRITDPLKSDSLVTHAFMGNTVALIGENLQGVKEIWFNDQKAILNTSFITNSSIIVTVPDRIPGTVTNELRMVAGNNTETIYSFGVDVPAPLLSSLLCEYVQDGGTAIIQGNYFINDPNVPLQVFFPGNIEGEVLKVSLKEVEVKVPAGVGSGPIVVKSIYGSSRSSFYFRDDRGIILDFDTKLGAGWRPGNLKSTEPTGISGKYVFLTGKLESDWQWMDNYLEMDFWGQATGRPQSPIFIGDPANLALKFEAYVVNDWSGGWMQFIFSKWNTVDASSHSDGAIARGFWRPWEESGKFKTDGWITVTIPLSDFKYNHDASLNNLALIYPDNCGSLSIFVWGPVPAACDIKIGLDNVRIVQK